jgi:hypothetical protein
MNIESIRELPEYHGIFFDARTGKTYTEDGRETGFTFEDARWTGPFGLHFFWPKLNPLGFATKETGLKVLHWATNLLPGLSVSLDEADRVAGPFTRTVERMIVVSDGSAQEAFNAGWLANSIIRNGQKQAGVSFLAEVRQARIQVDSRR